jgi:glycosyltransferase involved in cell wall biosynthesis
MTLKVAAFTAGAAVPAARFRVRQYVKPLADQHIELDEFWPGLGSYPPRSHLLRPAWLLGTLAQRVPQLAAASRADVVLFQRELVSTLPTLEAFTRRPRIVDIDDAIHLFRGGKAMRHLARLADLVIVGNGWLAQVWRQSHSVVEVLPTAVDTDRYIVAPLPDPPVMGWIGTAGNLGYLRRIAPALAEVVRRFPRAEIAVCCDERPDLGALPLRYIPWSEVAEESFLASISIGLMPLDDNDWERGKCSYKMLQYMAAGRPSVVSPVGMNSELLSEADAGTAARTDEDWVRSLCALLADGEMAEEMGRAGRALAERRYSVRVLAPRLAELLRRVS